MSEDRQFVDIYSAFPNGMKAMVALEEACQAGSLEPFLYELVKMRSSQINGCAYCLDMHYKDARAMGETEERLYMLNAWREATIYTEAERAALALTEEITKVSEHHVSLEVEKEARKYFDETSYANLIFLIVVINSWNRLAISSHSPAGKYKSTKKKIK
ncbi:MAG: carboxymuconolactone decarboxylase family protein [Leptospiraceae bacterium]|nr:carboxymuconolactone decarboxylase family protein [Leptospiraceae bacterium]MCK6380383.1 carboxymuconolactone decarboxylase family protein [Leptospiraceae bacterium]NUM41780.1 carboxymuconolactone decarboxylase family protein [Leptospiraceae bacterium]